MGLTVIYSVFIPNSRFLLFFDESYLDLLALIDTGGNGKLNLLTYPLSLYLICAVTCLGYLRTKKTKYLDFLVLMWTSVLIARIISIFARGGVVVDIYFYVGILPEFIIAPFFFSYEIKLIDLLKIVSNSNNLHFKIPISNVIIYCFIINAKWLIISYQPI